MTPLRTAIAVPFNRRRAMRGAASAGAIFATGLLANRAAAAWPTGLAQATPAAQETATIPDTEIGREFASWLDAVNSQDPDLLRAHHETYSSPDLAEGLAAADLMHAKQWDALVLHRYEETSETRLTALVEATLSEEWLSMNYEHDGERQAFDVMPAEPLPGVLPTEPLDDDALAAEMERYLDKLSGADVFSGAVLVARNGELVYSGAYGQADAAQSTPNQLDTRFNLGSMNKMVTAVAIGQLHEEGSLTFDDPIALHLPDYPTEVAEKVTIHHLLTHTSGLGDFFGPTYLTEKESLLTLNDYLALFVDEPLQFEPGKRHEYSNAGFIVLGLIIEAVTGQDYFDHVRETVYLPAGMNETDSFERDANTPNLAIGYNYPLPEDVADLTFAHILSGRQPNDDFLAPRGTSAGGGYSTVEDLLRFDQALHSDALLTPETVATLIEGKVDTPMPEVQYAYGFTDDQSGTERIVGHNGGAPGISAWLDMYWDLDATVVALGNYDHVAQLVSMKAKRLLAPN